MKTMKTMRFPMLVMALCLGLVAYTQQRHETFRPKQVWTDTDGNPINAHGGRYYVIQTPQGFIACFDMWNKYDLGDSRYIWLPLTIDAATGAMSIPWREEWSPE